MCGRLEGITGGGAWVRAGGLGGPDGMDGQQGRMLLVHVLAFGRVQAGPLSVARAFNLKAGVSFMDKRGAACSSLQRECIGSVVPL